MSVYASSSNDSQLQPHFASSLLDLQCILSRPSSFIFTTFSITTVLLLLPLCIFILHHGLHRWRQRKRSTSSVSHSDCFTYHLVAMELVHILGCVLSCCGVCREDLVMMLVGGVFSSFTWFGEAFFHVLTCVERYLAVVHPITYLSLRNQRGIRIRNISIACVWMFCFACTSLVVEDKIYAVQNFSILISSLIITSFCSLSVLCVLIRPGPGEQGGGRERVDQSKQRAFYTIVAIMGVLALRCVSGFVWSVMHMSREKSACVIMATSYWFTVPCSLVIPLLFLHREGKLACC